MSRSQATFRRTAFRRTLFSEWTKLYSVRSTALLPLVLFAGIPAMAVFVAATLSLQPDDTILGGSLTGAVLGQMVAGILGVLVVGGEYGTGMIRLTLAGRPQRSVVLAAKAVLVAGVTFTAALGAGTVAYLIGTATLSGRGYATGEPFPALIGVAVSIAAIAVLGLAVGAMLRHTTGGIVAVLAVIVLPALFGPLLGDLQRWIVGASPTAALQKLAQSSDATPDAVGSLAAWPSLWLVCLYTLATLAAAALLTERRDV